MAHDLRGGAARPAGNAPVIRGLAEYGDDDTFDLRRLLPAWIMSGVVHVLLLSALLLIGVRSSNAEVSGMQPGVIEVPQDEDKGPVEANFDNPDIGLDPIFRRNFDVDRIDEISLPGQVMMNEALGVPGGQGDVVRSAMPSFSNSRLAESGEPGRGPMTIGPALPFTNDLLCRQGSGATREKALNDRGGNAQSEAAVALGLKWIVRHQAPDGRWSLHAFHDHGNCNCGGPGGNHDSAATALGLLPLLGAGETHKGTGKNHLYSKKVYDGLKWLISRQGADGAFSNNGYEHSICTIAICEAYGMTMDPWLKGPAQRAMKRCESWQRPGGGFRYAPPPAGDHDLSVSGWFVQAAKSAQMSGLIVPNSTFAGINQYLDSVAIPSGDGYGYQAPNPTPTMTAVGLLSRQYMGWGPRNPGLAKGVENLQKVPPGAIKNIYYYYYATQVMYHHGGTAWDEWNPRMRDLLIASQDQGLDPQRQDQKGSWSAAGDAWGSQLGRFGYTSLSLLTLEVYYRHLPLYSKQLAVMKDEAIRDGAK